MESSLKSLLTASVDSAGTCNAIYCTFLMGNLKNIHIFVWMFDDAMSSPLSNQGKCEES